MSVGLVLVSHSSSIAEGIVELAAQMAADVRLVAAGGTDDGGIGTSFTRVSEAIVAADDGAGVVVLCDLGSAILTTETALDFLDDELRERVRIADAPIVEGAVAAAVTAQTGGDLAAVLASAESANGAVADVAEPESSAPSALRATTTLVNRDGLHARPAAQFVTSASGYQSDITVNGKSAKSLLGILALGLPAGSELVLEASGVDAQQALDALVALIESGFGEALSE